MKYSICSERIISDPVSWIHSSRTGLPDLCCEGIPRGIINKTLVRQFSLDEIHRLESGVGIIQVVVDNWYLLREAAWSMACQRYRAWILQNKAQDFLTPKARSFMMLNIVPAGLPRKEKVEEIKIWQLAYAELTPLNALLPDALIKRIRLLFPEGISDVSVERQSEFDSVLFLMAVQHAKKFTVTL
ncbi:hypothetical protein [Winslowiella toletana]|uniref:hypothetical protein n=1 Tax=Winslowiella toletana TaxID=92490 RepID=UPI0028BEE640|nr:hypothetical protein [Winslowiella toletana]WNN44520.1 hypothetical protein RIN69_00965 [Winslowiella toletana]